MSALSPDGRQRWDGSSWVPIPPSYAPHPDFIPAPIAAPPPERKPTSWTRPLQIAVAAWFAISALWGVGWTVLTFATAQDYTRQTALRQAARSPALYPDPAQYASTMSTIAAVSVVVVVTIVSILSLVAIVSALRRWTWAYYALLGWQGLSIASIPFSVVNALGRGASGTLPPILEAEQWADIAYGVVGMGLFAWMLVALLRRGPWATTR